MGRKVLRMLIFVGSGLLLAVGALWLLQRQLIYLPDGSPGPAPAGWGDVAFTTGDGLTLDGWFHPPEGDAAIVVVFNGNAGNRRHRIGLGSAVAAEGLGVVLFDYRGYGGNPGSPTEQGLTADADAVTGWVAANHPEHSTVLLGESLGAAVATRIASERPPSGLVLRSPFESLAAVAAVHYPFLPVRALLWDRYPTEELIGDVDAPLVVIAGSDDRIVPPEQSRSVFDTATGDKRWVMVDGAGHNDPRLGAGDEVVDAVVEVAAS